MMFTCFDIVHTHLPVFTGRSDILVLFVELNGVYFCVWLAFSEIVSDVDVAVGDEFDSAIDNECTDAI
jgi:hypothetical protein